MRYKYPRSRVEKSDDSLRVVFHTSSLVGIGETEIELLSILLEFQRERGLVFWRTPENPQGELPLNLQDVTSLSYEPAQPSPHSNFGVITKFEHGKGWASGFSRWDDETFNKIFSAPTSSPKYAVIQESLLALDASEAVSGSIFVTASEDLLIRRDWLQDRLPVFIVGLAEAIYFLDICLKRRGVYAYQPSSYISGEQGYYFQRVCDTIPKLPPSWTTSLMGAGELPNGPVIQRYLESFNLRLVPMFEIKDKIADQFYRLADNSTQYVMIRELNVFFPLATGSFDALAWTCRYLYDFRAHNGEEDWDLRRRVILKLRPGQSTNGLIAHIEKSNKSLGKLLRSDSVQKLLAIF